MREDVKTLTDILIMLRKKKAAIVGIVTAIGRGWVLLLLCKSKVNC